jgi:para-aminobenzoate synthetase/4-amino-4-deoxychorismate lyase
MTVDSQPDSPDPNVRAFVRDPAGNGWLRFEQPHRVLVARGPAAVATVLESAERLARVERHHVVGFLTYEAASALSPVLATRPPGPLPLAWFAVFGEPERIVLPEPRAPLTGWTSSLDTADYHRAIATIRNLIAAGDTYQVNFSYRLRTSLDALQNGQLEHVFAALVQQQPDGFGAFIETAEWAILSASHELFFDWRPPHIVSRPMKGTVARGADAAADAANAAWLASSAKNRAENLMITDMVRNDLGRIARPGSVRASALFAAARHPTLWQLTSTVEAETTASLVEIMRALFPAASITGAPKRRAMEIIRDLETDARGIYTGTIGRLRPDGSACFNVAIRTVFVDRSRGLAEYGVGGGIVWDSDADDEYAETRAKSLIVNAAQPQFELLETLRWDRANGYVRLDLHLERLAAAASYFGYPVDMAAVRNVLATAAAAWSPHVHRVRLLINARGCVRVSATVLQPLPADYRVALAPNPLPVDDDPFIRHKTTHRPIYETARASAPQADDVLLWNERGELTESTIANLVVELDGEWVTPPASCGLLPGVQRRELLESGRICERVVLISDLPRCTGLALVNSLRGWWTFRLVEARAHVE